MPIDPHAPIEITAFEWVPPFAEGFVRDLRPRWACEEMNLPYRERLISAIKRPDWYFEEQPWGQVPHVRDGEIAIFESGATLIHLGEKGGLLPRENGQARASVLSWTLAAFSSIEPMTFELGNVSLVSRGEEWATLRKPGLVAALGKRLDRLETALDARDWLADAFSIADIAMVTVLREVAREGLLDTRPRLAAYVERGEVRPAFQTAIADQVRHFAANAPARAPQGV